MPKFFQLKKSLIYAAFFCMAKTSLFSYDVIFKGVPSEELLSIIKSSSDIEKLKDASPPTLLGLKRRAEEDLSNIIEALHSQAYYGAEATFSIEQNPTRITLNIIPGPVYLLEAFNIRTLQNGEEIDPCSLPVPISLSHLKVKLDKPALPESILSAEDTLLDKLNAQGFAFASIKKRDVFADQQKKTVIVWLVVETGPTTYFGQLTIRGMDRVLKPFFLKKIRWNEGEIYNPKEIEKTQEALELSGLFRSVNITYGEKPLEGNRVPMEISVLERKQRSIGFGLNFTTGLGPGFLAEWEDRNIFGEGQKLGFRTDIWVKLQEGALSYTIPDFWKQDQNLIWLVEKQHRRTKSFTENFLSFSGTIERKMNDRLRISYGAMYKRLRSQRSAYNGTFDLFKFPLQLKWSNADSLLEPTQGMTVQLRSIPTFRLFHQPFAYCINTVSSSLYQTMTKDKRNIFAVKLTLGSIFGAPENEIPPPERFFAGSESTLRGYRYLTVSPLGHDGEKPLGGRSLFVYTIETRHRIGENFGCVFFYDIGNVYKQDYLELSKGILQSAGFGIRYYTPIGPVRLDVAFPLNKRHIDNYLEAYFSIGQSF